MQKKQKPDGTGAHTVSHKKRGGKDTNSVKALSWQLSWGLHQSVDIEHSGLVDWSKYGRSLGCCLEFILSLEVPHPDICDCGQELTFSRSCFNAEN